jgi:hypothetical protein
MNYWPTDKSLLELAVYAATILSVVAALRATRISQQLAGQQSATKAYLDYLKMAMEHPEFAFPTNANPMDTVDAPNLEQYEWYISSMLASMKLMIEADRRRWWQLQSRAEEVVALQISYHWRYLEKFRRRPYLVSWEKELGNRISKGIKNGKTRADEEAKKAPCG